VFVDWDGVNLDECNDRIDRAGLPTPTAMVFSGGGHHAYWRLSEPITDLRRWTAIQKGLIAALHSDKAIHDPPRIMRLPGYFNTKRAQKALAAILALNNGVHTAESVTLGTVGDQKVICGSDHLSTVPDAHLSSAPFDGAQLAPALTRDTIAFLTGSIAEGERNHRLFKAAVDIKACGMESLRQGLWDAAARHGLEPAEIEAAIRSAFSKEREPAKLVPAPTKSSTTQNADPGVKNPHLATKMNGAVDVVRLPGGMKGRTFSNHIIGETRGDGDKARRAVYARSYADCYNDAQKFTGADQGGGVRRIGTALFAKGEDGNPAYCPNGNSVKWIPGPNELFSWIGMHADLKWKKEANDNIEGGAFTLPTKGEMFAFFQHSAPDYYGIELLPHEPRMNGIYYAGGNNSTPDGWAPPPGEGKLWELIDRLNYATDIDKTLLTAMFLTPGWGGPPGARPAFVLDSPGFGQGTGKTTTADLLCEIWGLALTIGHDEKMEDLQKRLLSIGAVGKRVALLDNVKGRRDSAGLESIVTAKEITGHRLYVGNTSRPNLLTYVVTANVPRLSKDLADRSVIVHVGKARHADSGFMEWARNFIETHRASMIGDAIEALAAPPVCSIPDEGRDRWGAWQDGVLAKIEGGDKASIEAKARRKAADVDTEDSEDIADAIRAHIKATINQFENPDAIGVRFTPAVMLQVLIDSGLVSKDTGTKGLATMLVGLCGVGPCAPLAKTRTKTERFYSWGTPRHGTDWTNAKTPDKSRVWEVRD
jgi:hypothetical protein